MSGALNDLRLGMDDDQSWNMMRDNYTGFLASVVHEVEIMVRGGGFNTETDLEEFLADYVDTLEHIYTPSLAKKFMTLTRNAEACLREVGVYGTATDSTFWYQLAFHAQLADLKDSLGIAGVYQMIRNLPSVEAQESDSFIRW